MQADLDYMLPPQAREQYVMSGRFESPEMMNVQLSSRVCSFGKQVVERNQVRHGGGHDAIDIFSS